MSSAKLKFDLTHGVIDVEGSEDFVLSIYRDFKEKIEGVKATTTIKQQADSFQGTQIGRSKSTPAKASPSAPRQKRNGKPTPTIVRDLDLSGGGKCERLKEFFAQFEAKTNFERNLIFVYYLQHKVGMTGINVDHVFSCYRDVPGVKAPEALRQSLLDTSNRRGWLDTSNTEDIKVSIAGVNFLEHDMPKKGSAE